MRSLLYSLLFVVAVPLVTDGAERPNVIVFLSDDVGYRFSNRNWSGWPLMAGTYAGWLAAAAGDLVVLGWDYETFGEHHAASTGIFDFVRRFPAEVDARHGRFLTASEAIAGHGGYELPLPVFPASWAGSWEASCGSSANLRSGCAPR